MAIYHNSTKIISRSSGRSAIGARAYRSGEKMMNEYDGIEHDYSRKKGVVYSEILLPLQAKEELKSRAVLWNEVEKIEKSKNSQLAREVEVALPKELNRDEQIQLIKSYVQDNFVNKGMCADINMHDKGDGNPHVHVMLTMRPINENGEWGAKAKKEYILDKSGKKIKLKSGQYKSKKIETTEWNTKEFLQSYREDWAKKINDKLKELGIKERVDHRSYKEQGSEKIPSIHEGATARKIEKRGKVSDRIEINRQIKAINEKINGYDSDIQKLKNEIAKGEEKKVSDGNLPDKFSKENIKDNIDILINKLPGSMIRAWKIDAASEYMNKRNIKSRSDLKEVKSQVSAVRTKYGNKIDEINDYMDQMESVYSRILRKVNEIESLEKEISKAGIFNIKRKRELNKDIDKLKDEVKTLKDSDFYQREAKYSNKIKELKEAKKECIDIIMACDKESGLLYDVELINKNKEMMINNDDKENINIRNKRRDHSDDLEL